MVKTTVLIPIKNESKTLEELIKRINVTMKKNNLKYECIIVDDNSPDKTYEKLVKLSKKYPIKPILRKREKGLASAILRGFQESKGKIRFWCNRGITHGTIRRL